jgi:hypothetical protein
MVTSKVERVHSTGDREVSLSHKAGFALLVKAL